MHVYRYRMHAAVTMTASAMNAHSGIPPIKYLEDGRKEGRKGTRGLLRKEGGKEKY
jgi:hypothetical protein